MDRRINKKNTIDTLLNGARVLVVEDDPFLWLELSSILQIGGVEIVACCRNVKGFGPWLTTAARRLHHNVLATA